MFQTPKPVKKNFATPKTPCLHLFDALSLASEHNENTPIRNYALINEEVSFHYDPELDSTPFKYRNYNDTFNPFNEAIASLEPQILGLSEQQDYLLRNTEEDTDNKHTKDNSSKDTKDTSVKDIKEHNYEKFPLIDTVSSVPLNKIELIQTTSNFTLDLETPDDCFGLGTFQDVFLTEDDLVLD